MENYNLTSTDFILLGWFPLSKIGLFFFILIVLIFLTALFGNLCMILLIFLDTQLHTPMYFSLTQFSIIDLNYISMIVPKMISNFLFGNKSISFIGCGVQSFFFLTLAGAEALILTSMVYDCYIAVCFPLHYVIHMSKAACVLIFIGSWIIGSINSCAHIVYALHFSYGWCRIINHFFYDVPAILTMAYMETWVYEYIMFESHPLPCVAFYWYCVFRCLGSPGSLPHIISRREEEVLFKLQHPPYCDDSLICAFCLHFLCLKFLQSPREVINLAVFHSILIPRLNPIIYSMKYKEVMGALRRMI